MSKLKWMFVVFDMADIAEFIGGGWNNPSLVYNSLMFFHYPYRRCGSKIVPQKQPGYELQQI